MPLDIRRRARREVPRGTSADWDWGRLDGCLAGCMLGLALRWALLVGGVVLLLAFGVLWWGCTWGGWAVGQEHGPLEAVHREFSRCPCDVHHVDLPRILAAGGQVVEGPSGQVSESSDAPARRDDGSLGPRVPGSWCAALPSRDGLSLGAASRGGQDMGPGHGWARLPGGGYKNRAHRVKEDRNCRVHGEIGRISL